MELHGNARLTPRGRMLMCERVRVEGWSVQMPPVARSGPVIAGWPAMTLIAHDRSVVGAAPGARPDTQRIEGQIEGLRRLRWTSTRIAAELDLATSTVCAVLARLGLTGSHVSIRPNPPTATAGAIRASSSTSISRSWASSGARAPGHRSRHVRTSRRLGVLPRRRR